MTGDRTETNNVATDHADVVQELSNDYKAWAKRVRALPWKQVPKPIKHD
jgi:hypothetical protein